MPEFDEVRIARIVKQLRQNRAPHDARLRVRRMMIEMAADAYVPGNGTGTNIPEPFDKSRLVFQVLIGEVARGVQQYTAMVAANGPKVSVPPLLIDRKEITDRVDRYATEQERLLMTLWESAGGWRAQQKVTYSGCWGRFGAYFTLRRDTAYGMPSRKYYGDMTDDELAALKDAGRVTPEPIEAPDGNLGYAESGTEYLERRKQHAKDAAVSARSLYTLDTYPPDVIYPAFDAASYTAGGGIDPKYCAAVLSVPSLDCGPGSDYAKDHHRLTGSKDDVEKYGLYRDKSGAIIGGITQGGEYDSGESWTYTIFGTRTEVYCLVSSSPDSVGTLVWYCEHDFGANPFEIVPSFFTDSSRPGGEFSSPMEAVFSKAPILSQLETLLALVAGYNATARWVIIQENGSVVDADTGDPKDVTSTPAIGGQPKQTEIVSGKPFLLTLEADLLFKLVEFYSAELKLDLPSDAATGAESTTGTAWGLRQMIERQLAQLGQPARNSADGIKAIMTRWLRDLRAASARGEIENVYALPLSGGKSDKHTPRSLLEFDPANLVEAITVTQSSDTAQAKVIKQQAGIEALKAGVETMRGYLEHFTDEDDPRGKEIELVAYDLQRFSTYGDQSKILPNSALYAFALALRGEMSQRLMAHPPFAIATAMDMATQAQAAAQQAQAALPPPPQDGNMAEAVGARQPGMGMSADIPGSPGGALPEPVAPGVTA